jgi:hypothetical protein
MSRILGASDGTKTARPICCGTGEGMPNFLGKLTGGVHKDVVLVNPFSTAEVDFVADNPGLTLFHCHAQLHIDFGFMNLIKYV